MVQEVWDGTYVIVMNSRGMRVWPQMVMLAVVFPLLFGLVEPCSCRHVLDLKSNTNTVFSWFLSLTRPICLASSARRQVPRDLVSLTLSALPLSRLQGLLMQRQKDLVSMGFGVVGYRGASPKSVHYPTIFTASTYFDCRLSNPVILTRAVGPRRSEERASGGRGCWV